MTKRYICFHGPGCPDGMASAFAFWLKYGYENTEYIPVNYGKPVPEMNERSEVYIVDFSYSAEELMDLAKRMEKVVILDHHDTAKTNLEGLDLGPRHTIIFDMSKSGAVLAWEYLFSKPDSKDETNPEWEPDQNKEFFEYIQDRDLWQFKLPFSKEFSAGLFSYEQKFEIWNSLYLNFSYTNNSDPERSEIVQAGKHILRYQASQIKKLLAATTNRVIGGYSIPCINSPVLQSELGEALLEKYQDAPFVGCWYLDKDQNEIWSLRSRKGFDCNTIAEGYGGGGHKQACGFKIIHGLK